MREDSSNAASSSNPVQSRQSPPPLLSVGLPVYNGEKWIEDAIGSILGQDFRDIELIICDNASTDGTEAIARAAVKRDERVRYYRNDVNIGLHKNFDRAFELASGPYFKWAADSDFCLEGYFEKCVAVLEDRPDVVLVYPKAYLLLLNPAGEEVVVEYFDDFNLQDERPSTRLRKYLDREKINNVMHGIIRASALRKTSLIRPLPGSDISMVAELALMGKFVEIPERLFVRRFDSETSSMLMSDEKAVERDVPMGKSIGQRIDLHSHRFLTTYRAPISWPEKCRVWFYLIRRLSTLPFQAINRLLRFLVSGR